MAAITGTKENDTLTGTDAADRIVARHGADDVRDPGGSDTILLGNGDDHLFISRRDNGATETVRIDGDDGDDWISYGNARQGSTMIDLGTGDDLLFLAGEQPGGVMVTTGEGSDRIDLTFEYARGGEPLQVTDFTAGDGGDVLAILSYATEQFADWNGALNPFARGFLSLAQVGGDTLLRIDVDGHRRGHAAETLVVLEGVDATMLTAANLGLDPTGGRDTPVRAALTDANDIVFSGSGADRIHGSGGDDVLGGGIGRDQLWGDAGNDRLYGGAGNDQLFGGDGDDVLTDNGGSNRLDGGAGDDAIFHQDGTGGLASAGGDETILGGDGDDWVRYQNFRSGSLALDLGTGDDQLFLYTVQDRGATITTGAGRDVISFAWDGGDHFVTAAEVTDFAGGIGGDRLALAEWLGGAASSWNGSDDPFAAGFVRLEQVDGATLVQVDRDAGGDAYSFVTLVRLDGVEVAALDPANFMS